MAFLGGNIFETKVFLEILKLKSFTPVHKSLGNITTKQVSFTMMGRGGGYVGKIVCQFFGLGSVWLLGLSVSWLVVMFGIWFVCFLDGG